MVVVAVTALILSLYRPNYFLAMVSVFSFYLRSAVFARYRESRILRITGQDLSIMPRWYSPLQAALR
jgi:hypothetical protein